MNLYKACVALYFWFQNFSIAISFTHLWIYPKIISLVFFCNIFLFLSFKQIFYIILLSRYSSLLYRVDSIQCCSGGHWLEDLFKSLSAFPVLCHYGLLFLSVLIYFCLCVPISRWSKIKLFCFIFELQFFIAGTS